MKLIRLLVLLEVMAMPGLAQQSTDSLQILEEIHITDSRLDMFATGDKVETISRYAIGEMDYTSMAEMLMKYSAINVRSYGISGLSTASLRGTGSNHTAVFWEGINLQSTMNGSLDLTLVPVSFIKEVSLQYGSAGSLFGSGTMGGAIHLESKGLSKGSGWNGSLYQQVGSFGSNYTGLATGYRQKKYAIQIRVFTHQADNDFEFFNIYTNRRERRQNSNLYQQGLLVESYFSPSPQRDLSLKYWFQDNLIQVPEVAAAGGKAQATQADKFHRAVMHWQHQGKNDVVKARMAFLYYDLVYDDKISAPSRSESVSLITEVENTHYLGKENWLYAGLNHTYEAAEVASYGAHHPQRHRTALFLSYRTLLFKKLEASLGIRETLINGELSPLLPSLGLSYLINKSLQLKSKLARSYRIPTFNDLYWMGAGGLGNPDLQPEKGWSSELGVKTSIPVPDRIKASGEVTLFSNSINQWIGWIPITSSVWSPINVEQVWARGAEVSGQMLYYFTDKLSAQLWGNYTYTKSTKEKIDEGGSPTELHKQLIYTPYHQAKASINIYYQHFTVGFSHLFVGEQYATSSNMLILPYYNISDISLAFQWFVSSKHQVMINGKINNIWNKEYEVRRGYPMPGRNYHISMIYQFNQQKQ